MGFLVSYFLIKEQEKSRPMGLSPRLVQGLNFYLAVGLVAGARLGYILFYQYMNLSDLFRDPMEIIAVWHGGMSFHGRLIGTVIAGWWFCRRKSLPFWAVGDRVIVTAPIGLGLGRIANLVKLWESPGISGGLPWINYWLQAVRPENGIEISPFDGERLKVKEGDHVKRVSATNTEGTWDLGLAGKKPMIGRVHVIQGIRPGVVAFSLGRGHWSYGANEVSIDGVKIPADPRRGTGVHGNAAMRVDPVLKNTGLVDTVGGSAVFYQSQAKLVKV